MIIVIALLQVYSTERGDNNMNLTNEQIKEYQELKAKAEKAKELARKNHAVYSLQLKTYKNFWHSKATEQDKKALESKIASL